MPDRSALRAPLLVAGVVVAAETATHLIDFKILNFRSRLLDSQYEWSYSHLLATAMFGAGACICAMGALARRDDRPPWIVSSGLLAFLFLDGATRLHEGFGPWPLVYVPILCALAITILVLSAGTRYAPLAVAGLLVLGASLVMHVVGHAAVQAVGWGPDRWGYQIKVALKEGLELAGWTLLIPALGMLARDRWRSRRPAGTPGAAGAGAHVHSSFDRGYAA